MSEKIVSPGVFTKEIDQSFIPAALGEVGAAIVGPTVKGPVLQPTVVSSYGEYVRTFGELIESGMLVQDNVFVRGCYCWSNSKRSYP